MSVDDQRWKQIEAVYLAALDAPDRPAFLIEACASDPELLTAVELLLNQEPSTASLFGGLPLPGFSGAFPSSSRTVLAPGSEIGSYRIAELLGSGGSSDVYKAFDTRLERYVALKFFAGARLTEELRSRFAHEVRTAASLNHPNIATVYEVGTADNPWFIAMEYVDGTTLRTAFANPTCTLTDRLGYLAQAADALARAHANGIAHCDLKPENIMVTRDGLVKVFDFGLARLAESAEATGPRVEGTIGYMSPEQAAGQTIDSRSDVFSFGCMLFEAATDKLPFWSPSVPEWAGRLMHESSPRLETLMHDVPAGLQELIDDCLVKDPARRLVSMEDVRRRLEAILHHGPVRPGWRAVAVAGLAAVALAAAVYWQWPPQPQSGSVAVIPFVSAEATPESERLAERVSEGVLNALMQVPDLKVIARSSSFRFRGDSLDMPRVAGALGVRTLVSGRVVDNNGQLTISAELVSGDGAAMWGAQYTPSLKNVADAEVQIAREIARQVRLELTPADQRRLDKAMHPNAEAYSLLLRGRYELSLYTPENAQKATSYFEQALGIDPGYALANAELAKAYAALGNFGVLKPAEALRRGEQAALKAIATDPELPEAHTALASINRDRWQWADAERGYRRAIALNPSFVPARQALAIALTVTGQADAAVAEIVRARELDPVGLSGAVASAAVFYNLHLYDRALATLDEAANLDGLAPTLSTWVGIVTGGSGDFNRAITAFEKAMELGDATTATRCYYVHALARAGRRSDALRHLRALEREGALVPPSSLAIAYAGLGDRSQAIAKLEEGYAARDPLLHYIAVESYLDGLSDDPRFQQMVAGMGLPQRPRP